MGSFTLKSVLAIVASAALTLALPAPESPSPTASAAAATCTSGSSVVTAGYTINYAAAVPTVVFENGYQPAEDWAAAHSKGSYTFGVPPPVETGFAYAQFKCQYYCNNVPAGSFFVNYFDTAKGSLCTCFDDLLDPQSFVSNNQSLVGAWNSICK
ncbi:uncharacterized protein GGS22DRAFT_189378 [Annulohypoxylon maeteangense]|uniref:uncharacterized protein n=1 Tax=Annulohypoxylon maeteangense TaxID=1927788 RepID=UPI002008E620|nr:uncharacterized protein GGS22DRAFT_189378 [Annulohypoxylon maeteangense]KAI0884247.1 hypothetical protein GGS22DRAFT_189378 [Annulohypoxylon maeteangense]